MAFSVCLVCRLHTEILSWLFLVQCKSDQGHADSVEKMLTVPVFSLSIYLSPRENLQKINLPGLIEATLKFDSFGLCVSKYLRAIYLSSVFHMMQSWGAKEHFQKRCILTLILRNYIVFLLLSAPHECK